MLGLKISIITICYNAENDIQKTIESVYQQEYKDLEYIIIDGDSIDGTRRVVESNEERFIKKGIEFTFISEPDQGISDAFNKGIRRATGDIIGLINAGDRLCDNILQMVAEQFDEQTDIIFGNCIWEDAERDLVYIRKPDQNLKKLKYKMSLIHPSVFIRKKVYDEVGLFDLSYKCAMDHEMLLRMYMAGKRFKYIDEELTIFNAGGLSDSNYQLSFQEEERILKQSGASEAFAEIYIKMEKVINDFKQKLKENRKLYLCLKRIKNCLQ